MANNKRSGRFYRKNESEVMNLLGLKPTKNSGSGWIEKEDGQSENIICQLKSTDANSIRIAKKDLDTLNYNSIVCHKLPVFAIQFLETNEVYLIIKPTELQDIAQYLKTGNYVNNNDIINIDLDNHINLPAVNKKSIKSSSKAREQFNEDNNKKFKKEKRSAI